MNQTLRDKLAALLLKLDQSDADKALWNHAGVDYYDAADQILRTIAAHLNPDL